MAALWAGNQPEQQINEELATITESPGFTERVADYRNILKSLYISDQEISAFVESLNRIPKRIFFDVMMRCVSPHFATKYGFAYEMLDPRQIIREVCDFEYGRADPQNLKPIQQEYRALWLETAENGMRPLKERYSSPKAYTAGTHTEPQKQV